MKIEVSIGEVLDKYSILIIKEKNIVDTTKLENVRREKAYLEECLSDLIPSCGKQLDRLIDVNQKLWVIEDLIRIKESRQEFDLEFVSLARSVYHNNDVRASIKKEINLEQGSRFVEEKQYADYSSSHHRVDLH
jgi:hypothetical protein